MRRSVALLLLMLSVSVLGVRRRPALSDPVCLPVTLALTTSPRSVCQSEIVTLSWQASDPRAVVLLDGMTGTFASSGSLTMLTGPRTFSGRASVACGTGPAGTAAVTGAVPPTGSLTGTSSMAQNGSSVFRVTAADTAQWSITSTLGNPINPNVGTTSEDVVYTASRSGSDTLTARLVSACGEVATRSIALSITPATQPPPSSGSLRCCDGTLSPTCTSCAHKQGCCSSHGGVCGC